MRILAVANQKGGVGKTTTAVNLAALWATRARVLLIDADPQGNATSAVGLQEMPQNTLAEVLQQRCHISQAIVSTGHGGLDLLGSDLGLAAVEAEEVSTDVLAKALKDVQLGYDLVVIDCPPSLGRLTLNAMTAAERILVPVKPGRFSAKGLEQLFTLVESLKLRGVNPGLRVLGIVYNEAQVNTNLFRAIDELLRANFQEFLFDTIIPGNVRIGESQMAGQPVNFYDPGCKGAEAFMQLAGEVLTKWDRVARLR